MRTAFASFQAQKPTGIKSESVFPILDGQLEVAFPMKSSISTLNPMFTLLRGEEKHANYGRTVVAHRRQ